MHCQPIQTRWSTWGFEVQPDEQSLLIPSRQKTPITHSCDRIIDTIPSHKLPLPFSLVYPQASPNSDAVSTTVLLAALLRAALGAQHPLLAGVADLDVGPRAAVLAGRASRRGRRRLRRVLWRGGLGLTAFKHGTLNRGPGRRDRNADEDQGEDA